MQRRTLPPGLALGAATTAAFLGAAIGTGRWYLAVAALAPMAVALMLHRPILMALAAALTTSSVVFVYAWPLIPLGPASLYMSEALLFLLLLVAVLVAAREGGVGNLLGDRTTVVLGLFLAASASGVVVGVLNGAPRDNLVSGFRPMVFLAAYFVFRVFARDLPRLRRLLAALGWVAAFVVAMQALQIVAGAAVPLIVVGEFKDLVNADVATGFLRVRPPGLFLVYAGACLSAAYLLWGPRRRRALVAGLFALEVAGILLSFNRHMLIGLVAGVMAAAVLAPGTRRLTGLLATGVVVLLVVLVIGQVAPAGNPVVERLSTLTDTRGLQYDALSDRFYENGLALAAIGRSPVVGIGWGTSYGASATRVWEGIVANRTRDYVHNQYLAAWLRAGLLGLLAFAGLVVVGVRDGIRWTRARVGGDDGWLGLAAVAALVAFAVSSLVDMVLLSPSNNVVLAGLVAMAATLEAVRVREVAFDETAADARVAA